MRARAISVCAPVALVLASCRADVLLGDIANDSPHDASIDVTAIAPLDASSIPHDATFDVAFDVASDVTIAPNDDAMIADAMIPADTFVAPHDAASDASPDAPFGCVPPFEDCDGDPSNGCEVDLQTSSTSCGKCTHDCGGGQCIAALCQPVVLASGLLTPSWIAVDNANVYWTAAGTQSKPLLQSVSKNGGTANVLYLSDSGQAFGVAVNATTILWLHESPTLVGTLNQYVFPGGDGGSGVGGTLGIFSSPVRGVALDSTYAYVADGADVRALALGGPLDSAGTSLGAGLVAAYDLTVDGNVIYVTDPGASDLVSIDTTTGNTTTLASGQPSIADVAFDGTYVYFASGDHIGRVLENGTSLSSFATGFQGGFGIVADGAHVYWTTQTSVMATTIATGVTTTMATGMVQLTHATSDARFLYWSDTGGNAIYKIAKLLH